MPISNFVTNSEGHRRGRPPKPAPRGLRDLRLAIGLTVGQLATLAGLKSTRLSQIELGRVMATQREIDQIEIALGLPAGSLVTRTMLVHERSTQQ